MKKIVMILALLLVFSSFSVLAHEVDTAQVFGVLKSLEGREIPANFRSAFGSETVDAQLMHADGDISYFTIITKGGKVASVSQETASSPTVKVTVSENVLSALEEAGTSEQQRAIMQEALKNKQITVHGIGWRRSLRFGFYRIVARFL